jgi:hypothetical protein
LKLLQASQNCIKLPETAEVLGGVLQNTKDLLTKMRRFFPGADPDRLASEFLKWQIVAKSTPLTDRTLRGWFVNGSGKRIQEDHRDQLIAFLQFRNPKIKFGDEWLHCELTEVEKFEMKMPEVAPQEQKSDQEQKVIPNEDRSAKLALPHTRSFSLLEIEYLTGKYLLYRQSFGLTQASVVEVVSIFQAESKSNQLEVAMYAHPSHDKLEEIDPAIRPKRTKEYTEEYLGALFCVGEMYSLVCTYTGPHPLKDGELTHRIRYVVFPALTGPRRHHFGLILGYSPNRREPVAARIWAERMSGDPTLTDDDYAFVSRGTPREPSGPAIPEHVLPLIKNVITPDASGVLSVQRELVPPAASGKGRAEIPPVAG